MKLLEYVRERAAAQGTVSAFGSSLDPINSTPPSTADKTAQPPIANSWGTAPSHVGPQAVPSWDSVLPSPPSSHQHFSHSMWGPVAYVPSTNGIWADGLHAKSSVPQMGHAVPQSSHSVPPQGSQQSHVQSLWSEGVLGQSFR